MNYILIRTYVDYKNSENLIYRYKSFMSDVNDKLKEGYELVGGICYNNGFLLQAMIKKGNKNEN